MGGSASGPQLWGWAPPVALELALVLLLAVVAMVTAARRFSRAD
jgi:ABC-2 type transport system permease protein